MKANFLFALPLFTALAYAAPSKDVADLMKRAPDRRVAFKLCTGTNLSGDCYRHTDVDGFYNINSFSINKGVWCYVTTELMGEGKVNTAFEYPGVMDLSTIGLANTIASVGCWFKTPISEMEVCDGPNRTGNCGRIPMLIEETCKNIPSPYAGSAQSLYPVTDSSCVVFSEPNCQGDTLYLDSPGVDDFSTAYGGEPFDAQSLLCWLWNW
ncbi:hypothetical protein M501DRAFT_986665 [Patellaria atrata CBS 101060]|uniref:Uncharacterized protein n=1 Tax=Patellaria atrata CBS 101060 TaxID=1346257 RepID=A0A9P4S7H0_9PEZI|nr:hypothetical protein M501DRAFT_986665 [Patellaria atrata CBS 101060]